jgi:hypothetical protein
MIALITANDLKVKGITAIDELVPENYGVIITCRGREKYVVLTIEKYNQLREFELDAAIQEARKDISEGNFHTETAEIVLTRNKEKAVAI